MGGGYEGGYDAPGGMGGMGGPSYAGEHGASAPALMGAPSGLPAAAAPGAGDSYGYPPARGGEAGLGGYGGPGDTGASAPRGVDDVSAGSAGYSRGGLGASYSRGSLGAAGARAMGGAGPRADGGWSGAAASGGGV